MQSLDELVDRVASGTTKLEDAEATVAARFRRIEYAATELDALIHTVASKRVSDSGRGWIEASLVVAAWDNLPEKGPPAWLLRRAGLRRDSVQRGYAHMARGVIAKDSGKESLAETDFDVAEAIFANYKEAAKLHAVVIGYRATLFRDQGRYKEAIIEAQRSIDLHSGLAVADHDKYLAGAYLVIFDAASVLGDEVLALEALESADKVTGSTGDADMRAMLMLARAARARRLGSDNASALARDAESAYEAIGDEKGVRDARRLLA